MNINTDKKPQILLVLEELRRNSRINKHQHFNAGERNSFYNNICGLVAIVINVVLGAFFLESLKADPRISAFLSVLAAVCCGIQTFFNFQKVFEGHRKTANSYLEIQRECERLIALFADNLMDKERLAIEVEIIFKEYGKINKAAEVFPTGDKDYRKAMKHEKLKSDNASSI